MQYRKPTPAEVFALEAFAIAHGRKWREELGNVYWYNARIWSGPDGRRGDLGTILHGLRNDLGPTWLFDVYPDPPRTLILKGGARAMLNGTDPGERVTLAGFVKANRDALPWEELAAIRAALIQGEAYSGGGGAAAAWSVAPAPGVPS